MTAISIANKMQIFYSDIFLEHQTGFGHPERPERVRAVAKHLQQSPWANRLDWKTPTSLASRDPLPWILKTHSPDYIERVRRLAVQGGGELGPDTPISPQSYEVACLAVNAWLDGIDAVVALQQPAFVLARPPGHHALPNQAMGFCIFGNAAIAALYALAQPGIARVAILDWDVHHGNGTEAIAAGHPDIAYCSLHQYPFYPGTGSAQNNGSRLLNIPIAAGSTISSYEAAFQDRVMPFLKTFAPDLLIVSAGYDAAQADPLAEVNLNPVDFGPLTAYCLALTPKILFGLEGGYHLNSLAAAVEATLAVCLGEA
ncbi:histone deacetylase [Altericista sp. CCNU0014]|uniref:histone deacetylase family protein n=1 Tax=Altericista sp. CCNU0014 TaxID=3082949 RepID=UPI00384C18AA